MVDPFADDFFGSTSGNRQTYRRQSYVNLEALGIDESRIPEYAGVLRVPSVRELARTRVFRELFAEHAREQREVLSALPLSETHRGRLGPARATCTHDVFTRRPRVVARDRRPVRSRPGGKGRSWRRVARGRAVRSRRCSPRRSPMPMRLYFRVDGMLNESVLAAVDTLARERDAPDRLIEVTFMETALLEYLERDARRWLRYVLHRVVTHELDECLLVGGARLFDPHEGGRTGF